MEKAVLSIIAEVASAKEAKELLEDLEVLNEKYKVSVIVSIFPRVKIL
ncbi:hypothetical protein [Enterococcus mundtii]|nr:hypothetical protein [Enterococcus mundtii]MEC3942280.1 hypothetical protein [Enterococcus mundtii]